MDLTAAMKAFVEAACVPVDGSWHGGGTLDDASAILAAHPDVAAHDVFTAAILADHAAVARFLDAGHDPRAKGGPRGWDALTYLAFSRYLRIDTARSEAFVTTARILLDRGADPATGFRSDKYEDFETVLYGAAGVAHHPELTRLLVERGADPNDGETAYHAPEGYDGRALHVLVESGKLSQTSLATMLHRKLDWHDYDAVGYLLDRGVDPNFRTAWGRCALHHALERDGKREP